MHRAFCALPAFHHWKRKDKNMKRRIIEYKPSPGKQNLTRRLYLCALTLWRSLWLPTCLVGGLAYDVLWSVQHRKAYSKAAQRALSDAGRAGRPLDVSDRHLRSLESGEYIPSIDLFIEIAAFFDVTLDHLIMGKSLSDQEESLRNKLQQKRLTNQKLRLKLQRIMQKLSAIAEEL